MADFPIMPVGTSDFLADTGHLSDEEMGLYWRMCLHLWRMPERRFPNDDAWLAKRFNRPAEDVRALVTEFFVTTGNWIKHKRIEREFERVSASCKKQSDRAKSRWNKEKPSSHGNAGPAMPSTSTSSSLRSEEKETPTDVGGKKAAAGAARHTNGAKRGTRLPTDWSPRDRELALARGRGLDGQRLADTVTEFRNYWSSLGGSKATKLDWDKTFENRVLEVSDRVRRNGTGPPSVVQSYRNTSGDHERKIRDPFKALDDDEDPRAALPGVH